MILDPASQDEALEYGLASFYLGDDLFSVNIRLVREINPHLDITPARKAESFVSGLVNLRGQIVTVIDLGERLGLGRHQIGPESRLVILKTNSELAALDNCALASTDDKVGLLVDRISDVITPNSDQLELPPPNLDGSGSVYLTGVCKTDSGTMSILDVRRLLEYSPSVTEN
ncbi:MAG: purine-binding chemotaxis protein CheW [Myxococcales bacterium]|nr:purine-binding chemotaxis protein CheW [Myxococcales bacterium]